MTNKQIMQQKEETLKRLYLQLGANQLHAHLSRIQWQLGSIEQELPDTNYNEKQKEKIKSQLKQLFQTFYYFQNQIEFLEKTLSQTPTKNTTDDTKTEKASPEKNR